MAFITLEPGGARPPTTEEKGHIRSALGLDILSRTLVAGVPAPGNPVADYLGQWLRRETGVTNIYDWYQWNGVAWTFARRDGQHLSSPHALGSISGTVTLNRTNGEYQFGSVSGNLTLNAPINFSNGQRLSVDLNVTGAFTLTFGSTVQMPAAARAALPVSLDAGFAYRVRLSNIAGIVWLDDVEGPVDV